MNNFVSAKKASEQLGFSIDHLRRMAKNDKIRTYRTDGGQDRYDVNDYIAKRTGKPTRTTVCYCRVSGKSQSDDLESQVEYMQEKFPGAEIIKDYGSGINFKRKGLRALLERILRGDKLKIIVAHRDRLARFGGEVIQFLVEQNGGEVVVLDKTVYSPKEELTADLLTILHVFSCRMYGLRRYRDQIKEDRNLSNTGTEDNST